MKRISNDTTETDLDFLCYREKCSEVMGVHKVLLNRTSHALVKKSIVV